MNEKKTKTRFETCYALAQAAGRGGKKEPLGGEMDSKKNRCRTLIPPSKTKHAHTLYPKESISEGAWSRRVTRGMVGGTEALLEVKARVPTRRRLFFCIHSPSHRATHCTRSWAEFFFTHHSLATLLWITLSEIVGFKIKLKNSHNFRPEIISKNPQCYACLKILSKHQLRGEKYSIK